jgi:multiple sugar transport system permease protein
MLNKTNLGQRMVIYFLLLLSAAFALTPILWMASISIRQNVEIFRIPPALLPPTFTLEAFQTIFTTPQYLSMFFNSYFVGTCVTLVSILLATLAGYGFSRYALRGGRFLQLFIIGTQMLPPVSLIVPYFILISTLNLYDTYPGLIVTHTAFVLPFATLMLTSYFNTIPQDMEEAAMIDGCNRVGALWRVIMPMMVPGVIATGIYSFLLSWNEFLFSVTLTQSVNMRLVPVGIAMLMGEHVYQWSVMMGLSVFASIPLLIMFLFLQRYLIAGLTLGAVKT